MERNTIKIYFSEDGIINISDLANAKFLQNYVNIVEDKDFFDVINNQSFTSHFQPIIDMKTKKIFGYESLIRGVKRDTELMYPNEIFEKSRRNDLNFFLDRVCRETALKTSATKRIRKKVFINFLPTSIYDPKFCLKSTTKWANQLEFDPKNIIFEVVETEKISDRKHLVKILEYYREQGYLIALDDVGEGYSSLNMLIELKPNFIKVDREIITDIDKNPLKQSVYKALYNTAKENDISVLAEGIETFEEIQFLKEIGVDYGQGYFFGKPQAEPLRQIRDF